MTEAHRICEEVKKLQGGDDRVLLSFSCGKDAWATWCAIKDHVDVYPFLYFAHFDVCGAGWMRGYMEYCEKKIGRRIVRLPAPNTYESLGAKALVYQPPHRCLSLEAINLPQFSFEDVQKAAANVWGLPESTFTALGVRAADSQRRAMHFRKHGPISENKKKFYPVWDMKKDGLVDALTENNVKLPPDYRIFGRSYDGAYFLFSKEIKEHYPSDYEKILEFYPLLELEAYRYEKRKDLGF